MNAYSAYIPVLAAAVAVFVLLTLNPSWLQGKKYGDKPYRHPDPLVTSIVVFIIGAIVVWLIESRIFMGGACYRY